MRPALRLLVALAALLASLPSLGLAAGRPGDDGPDGSFAPAEPAGLDPAKRPPWLGPSPAVTALDCAGAETVLLSVGLDTTLTGTTVGGVNGTSGYSCVAWDESGPETVRRLVADEPLHLRAVLDSNLDLDLFLLAPCEGDTFCAAGTVLISQDLPPGESFLVIDGFQGAASAYQLRITCTTAGLPDEICDAAGGLATPVDCNATVQDSVLGRPDLVESDLDCGSVYAYTGGEAWYAVALPARQTLSASVGNMGFDAALWLYAGCGPDPVCLGHVDEEVAGGTEFLEYANLTEAPQIVYLAVDSFRPVDPDLPDAVLLSRFTLELSCSSNVPVRERSLGSLKALYR